MKWASQVGNVDSSLVCLTSEPALCPPFHVASGSAGKIRSCSHSSFLLYGSGLLRTVWGPNCPFKLEPASRAVACAITQVPMLRKDLSFSWVSCTAVTVLESLIIFEQGDLAFSFCTGSYKLCDQSCFDIVCSFLGLSEFLLSAFGMPVLSGVEAFEKCALSQPQVY